MSEIWRKKYFDLTEEFVNPKTPIKRNIRDLRYVQLGHWSIKIEYEKSPKDGVEIWGRWRNTTKTITIDSGIEDDLFLIEILWHELTHAILNYFNCVDSEGNTKEEDVCIAMGQGMALLVKDNPELMETLYDC